MASPWWKMASLCLQELPISKYFGRYNWKSFKKNVVSLTSLGLRTLWLFCVYLSVPIPDLMDYSVPIILVWKMLSHVSLWPHRLNSPWNSLGQNTGVGGLSLLQGIFPTQGDQTQVSLIAGGFFTTWSTREAQNTGVGSLSLLQWIFPAQELNWGLLYCRQILYKLSYQGSPTYML